MLWASVGVPLHSFRLRGSLATPSPPRRSTPEAPGRRARRRSRTRRGARDRSRRCSSRYALVPSRITTEVAGRAVYQGDQFVHGHRVCGCLRLEPKALAPLARLRHHAPADARLHGRRLARFRPPPPADGMSSAAPPLARRPRAARGERAKLAGNEGKRLGARARPSAPPRGMVRGASAAVASPQSWHRFRYPVSPEGCTS